MHGPRGRRPGHIRGGRGTVIEQQQVLTTHNLATLVAGLGLEVALRERMPAMARECFQWVCARLQSRPTAGTRTWWR